ncbi:MAG: phosphoribosylformylglycinamidine synthase I [Pirellulales bacterium]
MSQPRVLILRAPGTNCDLETAFAFERAGAAAERLHIQAVLERPRRMAEYQILCLPGGFSYGDDLAAGRILGNQIRHHLADCLGQFKSDGKLILGICNGFQILIKSGILLDEPCESARGLPADRSVCAPAATLTWNDSGKFEDRWVRLKVEGGRCVFFAGIDAMYLPVAHAEGKFVARDEQVLSALEAEGRLALRYVAEAANGPAPYPANPNGSQRDVAAICDATGRVCGLMPHPERHVDPTQHPRWTRGPMPAEGAGLAVFRNAVRYFA